MKLISILRRMLSMCPEAWYIFLRTIQLCVMLLFCAVIFLFEWNGSAFENFRMYQSAMAANETAQALLLIGVLFSVLIEDVSR